MGKLNENVYETAFLQCLAENGWITCNANTLHRLETQALLEDELADSLRRINADLALTDGEVQRLIANLRNTDRGKTYLSLRDIFTAYRDGVIFSREDSSLPDAHVRYIDFEQPQNNVFRAVQQFVMVDGKENRRPDILLFINGIPVCIIELKNPADPNADIYQAYLQIHTRYHRAIPSLMKYCALSCISDGANSRLGTTFSPYQHYYAWKKVHNEDDASRGVKEMQTLIAGAYAPDRLLSILQDFVYFPDERQNTDKEVEVVCRYPQFFATHRLFDSVLSHMKINKGGDGKGGTYFGATGCGKTFTMLFLARRLALRAKDRIGSPTILIIVDREDLQTQASALFCESKDFLSDATVREIADREDLKKELSARQSGGVFIITIQKFCEEIGFLSDRSNIICFSDEAHRTQTGVGTKLKIVNPDAERKIEEEANKAEDKAGAFFTYGFAYYLREAFPNATFVGFTGTPIDETIHVFGNVVDSYTMRQAVADGITVDIKYDARLARVEVEKERLDAIKAYYEECAAQGVEQAKIEKSKKAMASLNVILGDDGRLERLAADIVAHYEDFTANAPQTVRKAMIVCSDRKIAFRLWQKIAAIRPEWLEPKRVDDESEWTTPEQKAELQSYLPLPMVNLVATRDKNDPKELWDALGTKDDRAMLATQFKREKSHFKIAIVVDMWITGFDVPALTVLYNDKPLQKHTLIQTISRVNRKYPGKEFGLIVDYIGIRENMLQALKKYGGDDEAPSVEDLEASYTAFKTILDALKEHFKDFDTTAFFGDNAFNRLMALNAATEYVLARTVPEGEKVKSYRTLFLGQTRRLKAAFDICQPAGRLTTDEVKWSEFFLAIRSMVLKVTDSPLSVEAMNRHVEELLNGAIRCLGVEQVLNAADGEQIFSDEMIEELERVKTPNTKFQLLVKLLQRAIKEYGKTNQLKAKEFAELLQQIVDEYNKRDNLTFANQVASETVNAVSEVVENKVGSLIDRIKDLFGKLKADKEEFKKLGITFEEKAFYDILVDVRDRNGFEYSDERCIELARKINELIANSSVYADWLQNRNIKAALQDDLTDLLYQNGYPPEWDAEVFAKVMSQVENFKANK